ncbi:nucleoid-associated protein [Clostridioides sp. ZZV15-6597]|uniref:nucleoid-associated protein n=1 Tax=Clostridioides sp. ZZV15-6597 TaxID=2811500 RepID=UPI001D0FC88A|nr:nucleoid-associated protein [Clostridioides sp. ZZV15-6597]HBF1820685.1 nucleoid-associated protein [Clostridioides difficile]
MVIEKFIIHVLDKNSDVPVLNDFEGRINQDMEIFFTRAIKKVLRDDSLRKGIFKDYNDNLIKKCCEQIIYDRESFIDNSKEIASYLFEIMSLAPDIDSCDLAICLYSTKGETNVAILKLDYKRLYNHSINYTDDKFNIQMTPNEVAISEVVSHKQAAVIGISGINDEYHLMLLDKEAEKENLESKFVTDFLSAERVYDDKYKTKMFKNTVENWITNALNDDIKKAEDLRSILNYELKEKNNIDIDVFIENHIDDKELKESLKDHLEEKDVDKSFEVDKKWIEKKLKKRNIKTDNGFELKGNLSDFEDPMKYGITNNPDGTINVVLKNVSFFS